MIKHINTYEPETIKVMTKLWRLWRTAVGKNLYVYLISPETYRPFPFSLAFLVAILKWLKLGCMHDPLELNIYKPNKCLMHWAIQSSFVGKQYNGSIGLLRSNIFNIWVFGCGHVRDQLHESPIGVREGFTKISLMYLWRCHCTLKNHSH